MEKIKQISRKYIIEDDFDRLMDSFDKLNKLLKKESIEVMENHLVEITAKENECFIEFDNIESIKTEETNIIPYLEYVLQIYKNTSSNLNCIRKPVIKIEPSFNYMEISVNDVKITIKHKMVDNIFESLKNSGLIDSYSVYSSEEKYQKIKKCDYCLSPDEFGFNFYQEFEIPKIEQINGKSNVQNFDVMAVPCDKAFVVSPEKTESFLNVKPNLELRQQNEELLKKLNIEKETEIGLVLTKKTTRK